MWQCAKTPLYLYLYHSYVFIFKVDTLNRELDSKKAREMAGA